jgi:hypothetical protein
MVSTGFDAVECAPAAYAALAGKDSTMMLVVGCGRLLSR